MFRDGIGVVVDGYLDDDGVFRSKTLLVKTTTSTKRRKMARWTWIAGRNQKAG